MAGVSGCTVEQYCRRDRNVATKFAHFLPENGALSYGDAIVEQAAAMPAMPMEDEERNEQNRCIWANSASSKGSH